MFRKIWAVFVARNKEFYRDKGVMAWNFLFPVLVVVGFAYAFSGRPQDLYKVAVFQPSGAAAPEDFFPVKYTQFIRVRAWGPEVEKVRRHKIDLLLALAEKNGEPSRYWINTTSPKGYFLERVLKGSVSEPRNFQRQEVTG